MVDCHAQQKAESRRSALMPSTSCGLLPLITRGRRRHQIARVYQREKNLRRALALGTNYTIPAFIKDAKAILANRAPLDKKKEAISEHLRVLAQRDDLTRFGQSPGPTDTSTNSHLLWRERPYSVLTLAQSDPGYLSAWSSQMITRQGFSQAKKEQGKCSGYRGLSALHFWPPQPRPIRAKRQESSTNSVSHWHPPAA